ncbi:hypothetical protein JCM9279_004700 [Rhodotorula babjevae]
MPLPVQQTPPWAQRASTRPSRLAHTIPLAVAFSLLFNLGILTTFALLVLLLPLAYVGPTRLAYLRTGKGTFGRLLVLILGLFSPTELVLSAGEGLRPDWVERGRDGRVVKLNLPAKGLWMSNHTTLADWLYLWSFAYLSGHSGALYIALKASLRRIPIIGWACHLFGFAFLERKWAEDRAPFSAQLERIARETNRGGVDEKMAFLLFPEGTIVTENTRGISKRFADKSGVADYKHLLVPRSTGLFFALRSLARSVPTLHLVDLTVGYPLPRPASTKPASPPQYASDFYTLPSVLLQGIPPPELHVHVRAFALADIPLGDLARSSAGAGDDEDGSPEERAAFERWLRDRWAEKDALVERFRTQGTFVDAAAGASSSGSGGGAGEESDEDDEDERRAGEVGWRVGLREPGWEALAAFSFFAPLVALWVLWHWRQALGALLLGGVLGRRGPSADEGDWEDDIVGRDCPCGGMGQGAVADKLAGEL